MSKLSDQIGQFTTIPESVIEQWAKLGDDAMLVFIYLRYRTNRKRGTAYPSYETIQGDTGMHPRKISRGIKALEHANLLERKKRFGKSTIYVLKLPDPPDMGDDSTSRVEELDDNAAISSSNGGRAVLPTVEEKPDRVEPESTLPKGNEQSSAVQEFFYPVAKNIFGITAKKFPESTRQRVGRVAKMLLEADPNLTEEKLRDFVKWWRTNMEGASLPIDPAKTQLHYMAFQSNPEKSPERITESVEEWRARHGITV